MTGGDKSFINTGFSQYEYYTEGLEQYLDSKVEFRFEHNLIITVAGEPPEK